MAEELKQEIQKRLKLAREKLEVAQALYEKGYYADSISRVYYAMYHAARAVLFIKNVAPIKHSGVIKMFGLHYIKPGIIERVYSKSLSYLKELRENADYEGETEFTQAECLDALNRGKKFVKITEEIINKEFS